jgi:hypothetical protein
MTQVWSPSFQLADVRLEIESPLATNDAGMTH